MSKAFEYNEGTSLTIERDDICENKDILFAGASGELVLGPVFSDEGGEGKIYKIKSLRTPEFDDDVSDVFVAKIYHDDEIASSKKDKILKMLGMINNFVDDEALDNVCWPYYAIYDNKTFVGFIMPKAQGKTLANLFYPDIVESFPNYSRKDLVDICLNIINKISQLHKYKIIIGDINEDNFIINSPNEIYFIDTDSYQFGKYQCKVERLEYKAPELIENDDNDLTLSTEGYSTAVLIFKILMLGKNPFSCRDTNEMTIEDRIVKGLFPYSVDPLVTDKLAPIGFYSYIWNEFSAKLKMLFINVFTRTEDLSSVNDMATVLNDYQKSIEKNNTDSIIPQRFNDILKKRKEEEAKKTRNVESVSKAEISSKNIKAGNKKDIARKIINKFETFRKSKSKFKEEEDYFNFVNKKLCLSSKILPNRVYFEPAGERFVITSVDLSLKVMGAKADNKTARMNKASKSFIKAIKRLIV